MTPEETTAKPPRPAAEPTTAELYELGCGRALGRYTLIRRIATGGMAEVYAARARGPAGFERKVAIKKILPQLAHNDRFIDMLVDEAKITVLLTHSSIAQVYELGLEGQETYFIVMEYVDGRPLSKLMQRMDERGMTSVPCELAAHILAEVAHGLDHAHRQTDAKGQPLGIVHRDITPQNVLISYSGEVKLIDFGIARAEGRIAQTQDGVIKGKLRYLAPEIALGDDPDHRADIYCCGIVLFELLTGEALFSPRSDLEAIQMASEARVRSPRSRNPQVPEALDDIVMRALRRDRGERYQSAKDLATDLERFLIRERPEFTRGSLGDLMDRMYRDEIALERRIDARAEKLALAGGEFGNNERTAIAKAPGIRVESDERERGYKQLVTRVRIGSDPGQRVNLVGADGGAPMELVLADPDPPHEPRPVGAQGTVARPRAKPAPEAPSGAPLTQVRTGSGRRPTVDGRGKAVLQPVPSKSPSLDDIVSAVPTILRRASDVVMTPEIRSSTSTGFDPEATIAAENGLAEGYEAPEAPLAAEPTRATGDRPSPGPPAGEDDHATKRASTNDLIAAQVTRPASDAQDAGPRSNTPRGQGSRGRRRSSLPSPPVEPFTQIAPTQIEPLPSIPGEDAAGPTIALPYPKESRAGARPVIRSTSLSHVLWDNPASDIIVVVAIVLVVGFSFIFALTRSSEKTAAPTAGVEEPSKVSAPKKPVEVAPAERVPSKPEKTIEPEEGIAPPSREPPAQRATSRLQSDEEPEEGSRREPRTRSPRVARGELFVNTRPPSTVIVEKKKGAGEAPFTLSRSGEMPFTIPLPAGKYRVTLKGPDGQILTRSVLVEPGPKPTRLIHNWGGGGLSTDSKVR